MTLLEGPHLLVAAAEAGAEIRRVFHLVEDHRAAALAGEIGAEGVLVAPEVLVRLAPTDHPRGPVAVLVVPAERPPERDVLFLEVSDPGNAGTLIRTAAAFGLDVVLAEDAVDPWSPKVLRAGAGAHFATRISTGVPPPEWGTIATLAGGGESPADFDRLLTPGHRWAVIVGNEARGVSPSMAERSVVRVTVPTTGAVESLNAAVAGAIVAYEVWRWRTGAGGVGADR